MKFEEIENLSEDEINKTYDEIIEIPKYISGAQWEVWCGDNSYRCYFIDSGNTSYPVGLCEYDLRQYYCGNGWGSVCWCCGYGAYAHHQCVIAQR